MAVIPVALAAATLVWWRQSAQSRGSKIAQLEP
jgi:hypothetical protein